MADTHRLTQELAALEDGEWYEVLEQATALRQRARRFPYEEPRPEMTAEQFARWIAQRHLATDPGLREIMYLPENAPANEIRLIEVNVSALLPDEFTPEIQGWRSTDS